MHKVTTFQYQSHEFRSILDGDNPLFIAKDVCTALDLENVEVACRKLPEDEKLIRKLYASGQSREMLCVTEPGLYRLIFRSNKPEAEKFRRWVFHEVLPAIRKTGSYSSSAAPSIKLLEGEIKEGASLLSQVIGMEKLPDTQRWQLVDRLFIELFGTGVEILSRTSTNSLQATGPGPRMHYVAESVELLVLKRVLERVVGMNSYGYRVRLSETCLTWFVAKCCDANHKAAASQQSLYTLFSSWFEDAFNHAAPSFEVFHDSMIERFSAISLAGEPWFVGVAPAVEVAA